MKGTISLFSVLLLFSIASRSSTRIISSGTGYLLGNWTWHVDGCSLNAQIIANEHGAVVKVDLEDLPCLNSDLITTRLENLIPITLPFAANSTQEGLDLVKGWTFAPFNSRVVDVWIKIIDSSTFKLDVGIAGYYESHLGTFMRSNGTTPVFPTYLVGNWKWKVQDCTLDAEIVANGIHTLITVDNKSCLSTQLANLIPVALPFNPNSTKDDILSESLQNIPWNGIYIYVVVVSDSTFSFLILLNDTELTHFSGEFTRTTAPAPAPAPALASASASAPAPTPTPIPIQTSPLSSNYLIGNWTWNVSGCSLSSSITAYEEKAMLSVDSKDLFCLTGHIVFLFPMELPFAANSTQQDLEELSLQWLKEPTGLGEFLVYINVTTDSTLLLDFFITSPTTPGDYFDGNLKRRK